MSSNIEYLHCPKCEEECFKEYSRDLVITDNVRFFKDGEPDYDNIEVDGYCTQEKEVLFYKCTACGEKYVYNAGKLRKTARTFKGEDLLP